MVAAALVFAGFAVLFHVAAFVLESLLWTRPAVYGRFAVGTQQEADILRPMAYNQGFYNLSLALGVIVGAVLLTRTGDAFAAGKALMIFGTASMSVAGLVLASSGRSYLKSASLQFFPAVIALLLTIAA